MKYFVMGVAGVIWLLSTTVVANADDCEQMALGSTNRAKSIMDTRVKVDRLIAKTYRKLILKAGKYDVATRIDLFDLFVLYNDVDKKSVIFYKESLPIVGIYNTLAKFGKSELCKSDDEAFSWAVDIYNSNFDNFNSLGPKLANDIIYSINEIQDYYKNNAKKFL